VHRDDLLNCVSLIIYLQFMVVARKKLRYCSCHKVFPEFLVYNCVCQSRKRVYKSKVKSDIYDKCPFSEP
jgi:hypothetical protein